MLRGWLSEIGLDWRHYGTHSMRRTKATLICRKTKDLRAVQLLLGHSRIESSVRYTNRTCQRNRCDTAGVGAPLRVTLSRNQNQDFLGAMQRGLSFEIHLPFETDVSP
jgi:hypothetical protein